MNPVRLAWEPESTISPEDLERVVMALTNGRGNVSILKNGTLLFVKKTDDDEKFARDLVQEFDQLYNFKVVPVDVGGYLVGFHDAVAVFVSEEEFRQRRQEILERIGDLCFPGENISVPHDAPEERALIGIYARGKLRRDANNFSFHKRL